MVNVTINGKLYAAKSSQTILDVCRDNKIDVPTFCHDPRLTPTGSCRICTVEVAGSDRLLSSCSTPIEDGMKVETHSTRVVKLRKNLLEAMFSDHNEECLTCELTGNCSLQNYAYEYKIDTSKYQGDTVKPTEFIDTNKFFYLDQSKCIMCSKCVRVCDELQGNSVLTFEGRGYNTVIDIPFGYDWQDANCVNCGNCVAVCPVDALKPKKDIPYRAWEVNKTQTTCSYCGVGCQLNLVTKGNKIVDVEPVKDALNNGLLCVKGRFAYNFINDDGRLVNPLIKKEGVFVESSWDDALSLVAEKLLLTRDTHGPDSVGIFTCAKFTNEENYLGQKLARAVVGTNNVDHCARLCHATSVAALVQSVGSGAMSNSLGEIEESDTIFIIGSNPAVGHPVAATFMKRAIKKGAKLIVADPRRDGLAKQADVFMPHYSGSDIALINGMISHIVTNKLYDQQYIYERTEGFEELYKIAEEYTPEKAEEITGVCASDIKKAATLYASGPKSAIYWGMGIAQHTNGTEAVVALTNLALICGMIGKEHTGVNPLRGQNNVQGACDMACLPNQLPGYQPYSQENLQKFENIWGIAPPSNKGLSVSTMKLEGSGIKAMYIMGENPAHSSPDSVHVSKFLEELDFLVVQDIFMTETAKFADVILPAASFAEKYGTFTNTERRVQIVRRAVSPVGNSKPDLEIILKVMDKMGYKNDIVTDYENNEQAAKEVMKEIAMLVPQYAGVTYEKIERSGQVMWPIKIEDEVGTKFLHAGSFPRGKGKISPVEYTPPNEETDAEYPFILTTGRTLYHWHTMTMTEKSDKVMQVEGKGYIQLNPYDANKLSVESGDFVSVSSRRGMTYAQVRITEDIKRGIGFIPMHFKDTYVNLVTNPAFDPIAEEPEFKVCAVRLEKVNDDIALKNMLSISERIEDLVATTYGGGK